MMAEKPADACKIKRRRQDKGDKTRGEMRRGDRGRVESERERESGLSVFFWAQGLAI